MTSAPELVALGLGANLGARAATLERAVAALAEATWLEVTAVSSWIETEPVGGPARQPRYLNGALIAKTRVAPRALLTSLQTLERRLGRRRERETTWGPRPIDIDLLLHGERRLREPGLEVPHPYLERRAFVLAPLAEIAPDLVLPSGRSVQAALARLAPERSTARVR